MKTVFLYCGQGSQYTHMGRALFLQHEVFRSTLLQLDRIAQAACGRSIAQELYDGPVNQPVPTDTVFGYASVFMVQHALTQALASSGVRPDAVLATSMGSFAATVAAGCLSAEDAFTLLLGQAELVDRHCDQGGMTAVLAPAALLEQLGLSDLCEVASRNFAEHFVVSAPADALAEVELALQKARVAFQRLPVRAAFHSRWIDAVAGPFQSMASAVPLQAGRIPVVCCADRAQYSILPGNFFWSAIRRPIRFWETAVEFQGLGQRYLDVGPGGTLATFLKYVLPASNGISYSAILTPFHRDLEALRRLTP